MLNSEKPYSLYGILNGSGSGSDKVETIAEAESLLHSNDLAEESDIAILESTTDPSGKTTQKIAKVLKGDGEEIQRRLEIKNNQ